MKELTLLRICLATSLVGIVGLAIVAQFLQPAELSIAQINNSLVGRIVAVNASIASISRSEAGHVFMRLTDLNDSNSSISAVLWASEADRSPAMAVSDRISATGQVAMYRGTLELLLRSVKKI